MNDPSTTSRDIWKREQCGPIGGAARLRIWIGNEELNAMIAARALLSIAAVFNSPVLADRTAHAVYRCGRAVRSDVTRAHLGVDHRRHVALIHRTVADLRNVVGGAASDNPTRDRLVEFNVVSTTVLFDPEADYYRQGGGILDEDHHLLVAQRLYYKLRKRGAYTCSWKGSSRTYGGAPCGHSGHYGASAGTEGSFPNGPGAAEGDLRPIGR